MLYIAQEPRMKFPSPSRCTSSCQGTGNEKGGGLVRLRRARSIARPRAAPSVFGEIPQVRSRSRDVISQNKVSDSGTLGAVAKDATAIPRRVISFKDIISTLQHYYCLTVIHFQDTRYKYLRSIHKIRENQYVGSFVVLDATFPIANKP